MVRLPVAVGVSRFGGNAAFIGKVRLDEFGKLLCDKLKANNGNVQGVRFDHNARTGLAYVTLREDGEREFMFYRYSHASVEILFISDKFNISSP